MFYAERLCKEGRDILIRNGFKDAKAWAICGSEILMDLDKEAFVVKPYGLALVSLFKE